MSSFFFCIVERICGPGPDDSLDACALSVMEWSPCGRVLYAGTAGGSVVGCVVGSNDDPVGLMFQWTELFDPIAEDEELGGSVDAPVLSSSMSSLPSSRSCGDDESRRSTTQSERGDDARTEEIRRPVLGRVVQLDVSVDEDGHNLLCVSTTSRTYVVVVCGFALCGDSETKVRTRCRIADVGSDRSESDVFAWSIECLSWRAVGSKLRDGLFGACFGRRVRESGPGSSIVYASRPGR